MTQAVSKAAEILVKVPFHDLDPAGIVWHGNYLKYLEISRCALLDTFDYNYDRMMASGYAWPIIEQRVRHVRAARFGDTLRVHARLAEWEHRLRIEYLVTDAADGARVCKATTIQVAVQITTGEMCLVSPDILFERLGVKR